VPGLASVVVAEAGTEAEAEVVVVVADVEVASVPARAR
jgi:hypothetical protein